MNFNLRLPRVGLQLAGTISLAAGIAGCETDRPSRQGNGPDAGSTPSHAAAVVPEMEAHGTFFSGRIETEVLLNRAGFPSRDPARAEGGGERGGSGFRGGFGGGGGAGGGARRDGGMGASRSGGMGASRSGGGGGEEMAGGRSGPRQSDDGAPIPQIRASNETPVRLHLRLTNHGTESVEIEVPDFNSDLGNFVVQPRKITIPAGASVEADPMTSRLGVKADEIALTVAIRADGRTEKQTLALKIKSPTGSPVPTVLPPAVPSP